MSEITLQVWFNLHVYWLYNAHISWIILMMNLIQFCIKFSSVHSLVSLKKHSQIWSPPWSHNQVLSLEDIRKDLSGGFQLDFIQFHQELRKILSFKGKCSKSHFSLIFPSCLILQIYEIYSILIRSSIFNMLF